MLIKFVSGHKKQMHPTVLLFTLRHPFLIPYELIIGNVTAREQINTWCEQTYSEEEKKIMLYDYEPDLRQ